MGTTSDHDTGSEMRMDHELPEEAILAEQVKQIYKLAPIGMVATVINALLVFFLLREVMPADWLTLWLAAIISGTLLRAGFLLRFRRLDLQPAAARTWGNRFLAGLALIGILWGSLGVFPFAGLSPIHELFIAFVLGGMAAGAATTFSPLKWGYLAFGIPTLAPIMGHFFLLGDLIHVSMGGLLFIFGLLLWRLSLHNYRLHRTSLLLRFENRGMIDRLQSAKEHVEGMYITLLAEVDAKLKAEAELRAHQQHLETIVEERTADLLHANEQLKAAQERLTIAKNAAEAANWAKSEFLANMSHEIRTPLAGAMGMINLVLDMKIGEEERRLLEMAKRSADSLLRLISDLLDFSRLEAGIIQFDRKPFPVARLVSTAIEVVSITAREKGLHLAVEVDGSVPETVHGDEGRLRQVLVNLLGNAVKFTKAGEVAVAVRRSEDCEERVGDTLLFAVRDTGIGIPPDQIEKIFGKFIQVDSSSTRRYGGTGLGLALSKQIIEKMGGRIWAESSVGAGSIFYFTCPLR